MRLLEGVTVNVLRKGSTDWAGDNPDGEYGFSHSIDGVLIQSNSSSSEATGTDQYIIQGEMYLPLGSDVLPTDRVEFPAANTITGWATARIYGRPFSYDYGLVSGVAVRFREVG